jgi:hypothetical protein
MFQNLHFWIDIIIAFYVLKFTFLDRQEDKLSGMIGSRHSLNISWSLFLQACHFNLIIAAVCFITLLINRCSRILIVWGRWDQGCLKLSKSSDYSCYNLFLLLATIVLVHYNTNWNHMTVHKNTQRKLLEWNTVMPERRACTQRCAFQMNSVPGIQTTLTTVHQLGQNRTLNHQKLENWDCTIK